MNINADCERLPEPYFPNHADLICRIVIVLVIGMVSWILLPVSALADSPTPPKYVSMLGVGLGLASSGLDKPDSTAGSASTDAAAAAFKIYGTLEENKSFSRNIELGLAMFSTLPTNFNVSTDYWYDESDSSAFYVAGGLSNRRFIGTDVFVQASGKLGLTYWNSDLRYEYFDGVIRSFSGSGSGMGLLVGLSASYHVGLVRFTLGWERYLNIADGVVVTDFLGDSLSHPGIDVDFLYFGMELRIE